MAQASTFFDLNQEISLSAGHDRMIVFARRASGGLAHIDEVDNGKACHCFCLACNEPLIARQGEVLGHSFAHLSGTQCDHALEAMLHGVAVELIRRHGHVVTPALRVEGRVAGPFGVIADVRHLPAKRVPVESVALDKRAPWARPCVVVIVKGRVLLIHIALDRRASEPKRDALAGVDQAAIEVDLTRHVPHTVPELASILFSADGRKSWLYNHRETELRVEIEAALQPQAEAQWRQHRESIHRQQELLAQKARERAEHERQRAAALAVERELDRQRLDADAPPRQPAQAPRPVELSPTVEYESSEGKL